MLVDTYQKLQGQNQTITPSNFSLGPYGRIGQHLFHLASCDPLPAHVGAMPTALLPLVRHLYETQGQVPPAYNPLPLPTAKPQAPAGSTGKPQRALVGFSGGKDSAAVAAMLQAEGYDVHLLHIQGLNRSFPQELGLATKLAEVLGMPLTIRRVKLVGSRQGDLDNRLKNQFICTLQLDYALEIGAVVLGQGNHSGDHLANVAHNSWFTDATENYDTFQAALPVVGYYTSKLANVSFVYHTIQRLRPDILPYLGSCILPWRFVGMRRRTTLERYGIQPIQGRCGVCYKCCWEYLILSEITDLYGEWDATYALHCLDVVRAKWGLFYQAHLKPADRQATLAAIVDQRYTPTPKILEQLNKGE